MNEQDRQAIEGLFARLAEAERHAPPKDAEADAYIRRRTEQQPGAPYMMAQTIVVQTDALERAQQRIQQLEEAAGEQPETQSRAGGMFGGVFGGGGGAGSVPRSGSVPAAGSPMGAPGTGPMQPQPQGGGFLAGAAQTAMGVAGGVLLGNAIGGMFGSGTAQANPAPTPAPEPQTAAQPQPAPAEPAPEPQPAADEGGGWLDSIFGGGGDDI